jgi:predicted membrane channel-forming protein YqfA (hemolysin III family)
LFNVDLFLPSSLTLFSSSSDYCVNVMDETATRMKSLTYSAVTVILVATMVMATMVHVMSHDMINDDGDIIVRDVDPLHCAPINDWM